MERFKVVQENPNDRIGGGGCVCGDSKVEGCDPPYAVFYATETDNNLSPHVVVCRSCAEAFVTASEPEDDSITDAEVVDDKPVGHPLESNFEEVRIA